MDDLEVLEVLRATLDAVDKLAEHALRVDGTVEAQQARHLLEGVSVRALQKEAG